MTIATIALTTFFVGFWLGSASARARLLDEMRQDSVVDEVERFNKRQADWDRVQREVLTYMRDKGDEATLEEVQRRWGRQGVRAVQELSDTLGGADG